MKLLSLLLTLHLQKEVDAYRVRDIVSVARALPGYRPVQSFERIAERTHLHWVSVYWTPDGDVEDWNRDTLEVVTASGKVLRAVEQYAATEGLRVVLLAGKVPTADLQRKPGKTGPAVVVFVAFRERFSVKGAQVRLSPYRVVTASNGGTNVSH